MSTQRLALLFCLAGLFSSCRYTTFPIIPPTVQGEFPARLSAGSLRRDGQDLLLSVKLDARRKAGYLGVVWFRGDAELGRDRAYLDAREPAAVFRFAAPEKGFYRAVITFEGDVLRQFDLAEVPIIPPAPAPAAEPPPEPPAPAPGAAPPAAPASPKLP